MVGGTDCAAKLAVLRSLKQCSVRRPLNRPSRLIAALASEPVEALSAIAGTRADARQTVWELAGEHAPKHQVDAQ